mmetsp:Transcript_81842/g.226794  ORF Transcript_81842/g.226794 Transcript_81842/m.226794 type:complete len:203 (-) Transcript_81842:792-1400(-)
MNRSMPALTPMLAKAEPHTACGGSDIGRLPSSKSSGLDAMEPLLTTTTAGAAASTAAAGGARALTSGSSRCTSHVPTDGRFSFLTCGSLGPQGRFASHVPTEGLRANAAAADAGAGGARGGGTALAARKCFGNGLIHVAADGKCFSGTSSAKADTGPWDTFGPEALIHVPTEGKCLKPPPLPGASALRAGAAAAGCPRLNFV